MGPISWVHLTKMNCNTAKVMHIRRNNMDNNYRVEVVICENNDSEKTISVDEQRLLCDKKA